MNKKIRLITTIVAASMLASTFAGCGKTTESSKTGETEQKDVTLQFAVWDYSKTPEYKSLIDAFQAENPHIKVNALDIPATGYGDKLTIMLASGDKTDVIALKDMPSYSNYAQKKQIIDLSSYISKDKIDLKNYQGVTDSIKLNGKLYALPYRSDYWVMFYNKDLFDKAKVSYPTNDMTWDQFRDTAKKLTSGSGSDQVYGAYIHTWKSAVMDWAVADGKGDLTNDKYEFLKEAYDVFLPMQNVDKSIMPLATAKTGSVSYSGQFETGKAAMVPMGTWLIATLLNDKKAGKFNMNWGIASIPHYSGAKAGTTFGNVTPMGINASSENKDAAWKFVKFVGTEKGATILAKAGDMPAFRNDAVMKVYDSIEGLPTGTKDALKTSKVALEFPPNVNGAAIDKILQEEHELIMIGKNSVDAGIANMNKRVKDVLNNQ